MTAFALPLLAILLSLGSAMATNETVAFRTDMLGEVTFNSEDTSDVAVVMLTDTVGIVCYADWKNPEDGQCNAVKFGDAQQAPVAGSAIVLTEDRNATERKAQRFTLGRLSDTVGVVCYTPFGDTSTNARPVCRTLTVGGVLALDAGDELAFAPNASNVFTMSVAGLTTSKAVLCFQDTRAVTASNRRDVVCQVLQASGAVLTTLEKEVNLTYANAYDLDNIQSIAVSRISNSAGMVCYSDSTELRIFCNQLSLNEAGDDLLVGVPFALGDSKFWGDNFGSSALSLDTLSESEAIACYCNGQAGPTCTAMDLASGTNISMASEPFVVGAESCSEVSVTAMSDTAAIVCYIDGTGVDSVGKCSGLAYLNGEFITGDAVDIRLSPDAENDQTFSSPVGTNQNSPICQLHDSSYKTNPCEHWLAVARRDDSRAAACYSGVGGSPHGRCVAIDIPEPTTTATTSTSSATSTTSEHTTTETSTSTATGTTTSVTTGTETSSTSPHTTTDTSTSETTVTTMEDSGALSRSSFGKLAVALAASWALL